MKISLKELSERWRKSVEPSGKFYGYPQCCINEFVSQPPQYLAKHGTTRKDKARYKASFLNGEYTGFIPCIGHARQILRGEITLQSLIKDRQAPEPFPNDWSKI